MSFLLFLAERYLPAFIRKKELKNLFQLTASAFGSDAPSLVGLSYDDCLDKFALSTESSVHQLGNQDERIFIIQERLFQRAYEYGTLWRKRFGITTMNEAMKAGKILYRAIGIDFRGTEQGVIEIGKCFFSKYYSPATCKLISSLDAGILAGLTGGGKLTFSQRITEGSASCKAYFYERHVVS
jgi:hypothetical protein